MSARNPILAVAWRRTSTDTQEASMEEQDEFIAAAAKAENLKIVARFHDFAITGDDVIARRKGLQKLFAFCEAEQLAGRTITCLVTWDQERLSRANSIKTAVILDRLHEAGVTKILSQEGWMDLDDELAVTMNHLKQDFTRRGYSRAISKNVSRSCVARAQHGQWCGGRRPYGYTLGADKHLTLDDPVKVDAARWLFCTYDQHDTSMKELARELERRGVPPPEYINDDRRQARERHRQPGAGAVAPGPARRWSEWNVQSILSNPIYTGAMHYARTHIGKYHRVAGGNVAPCKAVRTAGGSLRKERNEVEQQIIVPEAHPAIVDPATFERVQRKRLANRPGFDRGATRRTFKWLFGGLLYCANCAGDHPMWGSLCDGNENDKRYYCSTYCRHGRKACTYNHIGEAELLDLVTRSIREHYSNPKVVRKIREQIALEQKALDMDTGGLLKQLSKKTLELQTSIKAGSARLAHVPEDLLEGLVEEIRGWKRQLTEVQAETAVVKGRQIGITQSTDSVEAALSRLQSLPENIHNLSRDGVRETLRQLVDRIELHFSLTIVKGRKRHIFSHGRIRPTEEMANLGMRDAPISVTQSSASGCPRYWIPIKAA